MTSALPQKALVILTADKNAQFALRGILSRHKALHIKSIAADFHVHPGRDPGVLVSVSAQIPPVVGASNTATFRAF